MDFTFLFSKHFSNLRDSIRTIDEKYCISSFSEASMALSSHFVAHPYNASTDLESIVYSLIGEIYNVLMRTLKGNNLIEKFIFEERYNTKSYACEHRGRQLDTMAMIFKEAQMPGPAFLATVSLLVHTEQSKNFTGILENKRLIKRAVNLYHIVRNQDCEVISAVERRFHTRFGENKGKLVDYMYSYVCCILFAYYKMNFDYMRECKHISTCWRLMLIPKHMDVAKLITEILTEVYTVIEYTGEHNQYPQAFYMLRLSNTLIKKFLDEKHSHFKYVKHLYNCTVVFYCGQLLQITNFIWKMKKKLAAGKALTNVEMKQMHITEEVFEVGLELINFEYDLPDLPCETINEIQKVVKCLVQIRKQLKRHGQWDVIDTILMSTDAISFAKNNFGI